MCVLVKAMKLESWCKLLAVLSTLCSRLDINLLAGLHSVNIDFDTLHDGAATAIPK